MARFFFSSVHHPRIVLYYKIKYTTPSSVDVAYFYNKIIFANDMA